MDAGGMDISWMHNNAPPSGPPNYYDAPDDWPSGSSYDSQPAPANPKRSLKAKLKTAYSAWNGSSRETKYIIGGAIASVVVLLVVWIARTVHKRNKKNAAAELEKMHDKTLIQMRGRSAPNLASPASEDSVIMPSVPGNVMEQYIVDFIKKARYYHDRAKMSTNPLHEYSDVCLALGFASCASKLALPNTIQRLTDVNIVEYLARLEQVKMESMEQIRRDSPMLDNSVPFRPDAPRAKSTAPKSDTTAQGRQTTPLRNAKPRIDANTWVEEARSKIVPKSNPFALRQ
jgi:hypothetical protein